MAHSHACIVIHPDHTSQAAVGFPDTSRARQSKEHVPLHLQVISPTPPLVFSLAPPYPSYDSLQALGPGTYPWSAHPGTRPTASLRPSVGPPPHTHTVLPPAGRGCVTAHSLKPAPSLPRPPSAPAPVEHLCSIPCWEQVVLEAQGRG